MADPIIKGSLLPKKQATEVTYDPDRGQQVVERWASAGRNLAGKADYYLSLGVAYNFVDSPVQSTLVATSSSGDTGTYTEVTTDTWQVMANDAQKDICEHPTALYIEEVWPGTLERIRRDVENHTIGSPPPDSLAMAAGGSLIKRLLIGGGTHYAFSQYVLRHTTNVSNRYNSNISDTNINKTYTTAQLIAECTSGSSWVYPLPGRLVYKINAIPSPDVRSGYLWGWRKQASTETTAAMQRVEITTEYVLDQWPTFLYPAVT